MIELHIAPKTYYRCANKLNVNYNLILDRNGIKTRYSKFQHNVNRIIKSIFPNLEIIFEKKFNDCRNPKTNYCLRFDIYIPSINTIIECDGEAHYNKENYYNKITENAGWTPSYETDIIKNEYCKNNNIKLIRIPYKRGIIDKEYVLQFLNL